MDAPERAAQWALAVRSTLHASIAAAADCVRAVPAVRRRTRVRILRGPWRAERHQTHGAVLASPQRVWWGSRHPSLRKPPRAGHRSKSGKRGGALAKRMEAVLVESSHPHVSTECPCGAEQTRRGLRPD